MAVVAKQPSNYQRDVVSDALKKELVSFITQSIIKNGWSGKDAAEQLGVHKTRISYIMNGHIDKFTIDFLVNTLDKLGYNLNAQKTNQFTMSFSPRHTASHSL